MKPRRERFAARSITRDLHDNSRRKRLQRILDENANREAGIFRDHGPFSSLIHSTFDPPSDILVKTKFGYGQNSTALPWINQEILVFQSFSLQNMSYCDVDHIL